MITQHPKAPDPKAAALQQLSFISGYLYRMLRYDARELSIRWTALMVLNDLRLLGPSTQRSLATIEQVSEPTITVLLGQMQQRGWIKRKRSRTDVRAKLVELTPKGTAELMSAGQFLQLRLADELKELSTPELAAIASSLQPLTKLLMSKIGDTQQELAQ
jgi:DNA-binding MarR family transcriptional regulator